MKQRSLFGAAGFVSVALALVASTSQMASAATPVASTGQNLEVVQPSTAVTPTSQVPAGTDAPASADYTAHVVKECSGNACIYVAGIEGTTYIYWIDVFDASGIGGSTPWAATDMAVNFDGSSTGTYPVTNPPYLGICEEWNTNATAGTYAGWIQYYAPANVPSAGISGSAASGPLPMAPANPVPSLGTCD